MITKYHKFSRLRHKAILWSGVKVSFNFISLTPSFTYKVDKIKIEIKRETDSEAELQQLQESQHIMASSFTSDISVLGDIATDL